ncbi:hypothetical protein PHYSODRAFT_295520 [Phytophthora sojae]|uniref:Uncharacterized protein n=1 Tax=Phytophthora sojae (strain P6497) TaxID=1094619 RepID=G4YRF7_PHYSP|nr:hypothetical protein PHYSODRAFT_295520 [Phytophthora sojae]EGZ22891.1 hypothetical protein PHYSODRAFT_295520 [Phytophthora sojae]|eukprot:XP_009518179.1 hypothetical protein PHYSODRAFT_295520 [Phytophthora sojae]
MNRLKAKQKVAAIPAWKGVAEQQLKERVHAEVTNQSLRIMLDAQLNMTAELGKPMQTRTRLKGECMIKEEEPKSLEARLATTTDDDIFADQLTHVERAHLDVAQVFGGPEFAGRTASFYDSQMTVQSTSDAGVALVTDITIRPTYYAEGHVASFRGGGAKNDELLQ